MVTYRYSVLSAAVFAICASAPAYAGFQFSAPPVQQQAAPVQRYAPADAPMPIVPAAPVESVALSPMPVEEVLAADPAPRPAQSQNSGALVINPYPLQQQGAVATHNGGALSLDQAMLEETGQLKAVATPGSRSNAGAIARASVTSRYDRNAVVPPRKPVSEQFDYGSGLTPIPGGEGPGLYSGQVSRQEIERQPVMPRPAAVAPAAYNNAAVASAPVPRGPNAGQFADAVGFGRDLPLALALSQVVPPEYSFSFANNVDAGETVSWQGGKSWDAVLNDMLAPHGLRAIISGNQVTIQSAA